MIFTNNGIKEKCVLKKILKVTAVVLGLIVLVVGGFFGWMYSQMRQLKPIETAKISDSIFVIKSNYSNVFLVKKNNVYVAFDAGVDQKSVEEGCKTLSIDPSAVKAVFLTHSDADHVDGLTAFPSAKVYLSKDEEPLLKEKKYRHFMGQEHMNKLPVAEYKTLSDGQTVNVGGITVKAIATPGHTQGSMVYVVGKNMFTGDLCIIKNGQVEKMLRIFTEDMAMDGESIRKIAKMKNIERIYTAHSGYTEDIDKALASWR